MSKLQDRRKEKGLSQSQLAALVEGVPFRTIQYYEQGALDINKASVSTVMKLAKALDCKLEDILEDE